MASARHPSSCPRTGDEHRHGSPAFGRAGRGHAGPGDPTAPLVVLLHGRGSDETRDPLAGAHLPAGVEYAAVRAPIAEGGGYAWFANRGIGRPVAESLPAR